MLTCLDPLRPQGAAGGVGAGDSTAAPVEELAAGGGIGGGGGGGSSRAPHSVVGERVKVRPTVMVGQSTC